MADDVTIQLAVLGEKVDGLVLEVRKHAADSTLRHGEAKASLDDHSWRIRTMEREFASHQAAHRQNKIWAAGLAGLLGLLVAGWELILKKTGVS